MESALTLLARVSTRTPPHVHPKTQTSHLQSQARQEQVCDGPTVRLCLATASCLGVSGAWCPEPLVPAHSASLCLQLSAGTEPPCPSHESPLLQSPAGPCSLPGAWSKATWAAPACCAGGPAGTEPPRCTVAYQTLRRSSVPPPGPPRAPHCCGLLRQREEGGTHLQVTCAVPSPWIVGQRPCPGPF